MEFNNMINRFLKRDVESSKRRMCKWPPQLWRRREADWKKDIKTYAVTPLNEECGLIEWVDNLRTLRDIVIKLLRERGIAPNVGDIMKPLTISTWLNSLLFHSTQKSDIISKKHVLRSRNYLCLPPKFYQSKSPVWPAIASSKANASIGFPQSYMSGLSRCFQSLEHGLQQGFAILGLVQSCQWLDTF